MKIVHAILLLTFTDGWIIECPANTYKDHIGAGSCKPCPDYSSSPTGSTTSTSCLCTHGMFKAVPGDKYGTCQEYENQERIELGRSFTLQQGNNRESMPVRNNIWSHWYLCFEFWACLVFHGLQTSTGQSPSPWLFKLSDRTETGQMMPLPMV